MLIISDIHGCKKTLDALLAQHPGEDVYLLGDLIDRGPDSAGVVRWAMENNIPTVMGNHESLCLAYHGVEPHASLYPGHTWLWNGGQDTLRSFGDQTERSGQLPSSVIEWMSKLPKAIVLEKENLLLSHTGHGLEESIMLALWTRTPKYPKDGYTRVFGHTVVEKPTKGDGWINIDTGCAYGGGLTGLLWPSGLTVTVSNLEA